MKLTPLADRVILKMVEVEETTKGGIILTASAKEKPSVAEVISVGPGGMVDTVLANAGRQLSAIIAGMSDPELVAWAATKIGPNLGATQNS